MDLRSEMRERRVVPWALAGLTLVALGLYLGVELYLFAGEPEFPLDDSYIHLTFARSLAAGEGLSYQAGELVTGSTAPLWTALLSLFFLLPGPPLAWAKVAGALAHLAAVWASWRLGRELGVRPLLAAVGAGVVAVTGWLLWSAMAAMEVPLFAAVTVGSMVLHLRERRDPRRVPLSLAGFSLAVLLRPEGLLLLMLAPLDRLLPTVREGEDLRVTRRGARSAASWRGIVLATSLLVPVALFYRLIGGSWLPTTFATKMSYGEGWGWPSPGYLATVAGIFVQAQPVAALLAPAGALVLLRRLGSGRDRGLLPALWLFALPLAFAIVGSGRTVVGNFGRYYFPLFPVLVILAVLAVDEVVDQVPLSIRLGKRRLAWAPLLGILLLLPSVYGCLLVSGRYAQSLGNVRDSDVRMALWIREHVPPEALLAVNDVGAFGWYLENPLVDLAGIVTPQVHGYARQALARGETVHHGILDFVRTARPDYLVVFPGWFGPVLATGEFAPLLSLEVADNITMADDRVVLYATPWTRFPLRLTPSPETGP